MANEKPKLDVEDVIDAVHQVDRAFEARLKHIRAELFEETKCTCKEEAARHKEEIASHIKQAAEDHVSAAAVSQLKSMGKVLIIVGPIALTILGLLGYQQLDGVTESLVMKHAENKVDEKIESRFGELEVVESRVHQLVADFRELSNTERNQFQDLARDEDSRVLAASTTAHQSILELAGKQLADLRLATKDLHEEQRRAAVAAAESRRSKSGELLETQYASVVGRLSIAAESAMSQIDSRSQAATTEIDSRSANRMQVLDSRYVDVKQYVETQVNSVERTARRARDELADAKLELQTVLQRVRSSTDKGSAGLGPVSDGEGDTDADEDEGDAPDWLFELLIYRRNRAFIELADSIDPDQYHDDAREYFTIVMPVVMRPDVYPEAFSVVGDQLLDDSVSSSDRALYITDVAAGAALADDRVVAQIALDTAKENPIVKFTLAELDRFYLGLCSGIVQVPTDLQEARSRIHALWQNIDTPVITAAGVAKLLRVVDEYEKVNLGLVEDSLLETELARTLSGHLLDLLDDDGLIDRPTDYVLFWSIADGASRLPEADPNKTKIFEKLKPKLRIVLNEGNTGDPWDLQKFFPVEEGDPVD